MEGDVDNITDKLTPRALTKCDTNALLMAMEVSRKKTKCLLNANVGMYFIKDF